MTVIMNTIIPQTSHTKKLEIYLSTDEKVKWLIVVATFIRCSSVVLSNQSIYKKFTHKALLENLRIFAV